MPTALRLRCLAALPLGLLLVCLAGCSSDADGPRGSAARSRPPAKPLAGHENFFENQLLAEIHVGTDGMPEPAPGGERGGSGGGRGRRGGAGGGRMNLAGSGGGVAGNIGGSMPFGGGGRGAHEPGDGGSEAGGPRPLMMGASGRPVLIHLRFTNQGAAAVTLQILDFVSPLGNFVVHPGQLVLEPGQALETEPMASQLAGELSELAATLRLRLGGRTEKKTFLLQAMPAAPAPEK